MIPLGEVLLVERLLDAVLPHECPGCGYSVPGPHGPRCKTKRAALRVLREAGGGAATRGRTRIKGHRVVNIALIFQMLARDAGFRAGIRAAASFAGEWDQHITGTRYHFEDIVLAKFNQLAKAKMRRKAK